MDDGRRPGQEQKGARRPPVEDAGGRIAALLKLPSASSRSMVPPTACARRRPGKGRYPRQVPRSDAAASPEGQEPDHEQRQQTGKNDTVEGHSARYCNGGTAAAVTVRSPGAGRALDCSRPATAVFWGAIGAALAVAAFLLQDAPNWASALRVGSRNPLRHQIERELGPITVATPTGHDGQLYYLIARDPFGRGPTVDALIQFDTPRYRYRRILFPLLAGGFGQFSPRTTLLGMITCTILGMALTAIGIADLAFMLRIRGESVLLATFNLGAIVSVMLLTVDVMALGLSLIGVALLVRPAGGRCPGGPRAVRAHQGDVSARAVRARRVAMARARPSHRRRPPAGARGTAPLLESLVDVRDPWHSRTRPARCTDAGAGSKCVGLAQPGRLVGIQLVFAVYTLVSFALASVMLAAGRHSMLRWVVAAWLALACVTGAGVWGIPTNVARAFAMLWPLAVLLLFGARPGVASGSAGFGRARA